MLIFSFILVVLPTYDFSKKSGFWFDLSIFEDYSDSTFFSGFLNFVSALPIIIYFDWLIIEFASFPEYCGLRDILNLR